MGGAIDVTSPSERQDRLRQGGRHAAPRRHHRVPPRASRHAGKRRRSGRGRGRRRRGRSARPAARPRPMGRPAWWRRCAGITGSRTATSTPPWWSGCRRRPVLVERLMADHRVLADLLADLDVTHRRAGCRRRAVRTRPPARRIGRSTAWPRPSRRTSRTRTPIWRRSSSATSASRSTPRLQAAAARGLPMRNAMWTVPWLLAGCSEDERATWCWPSPRQRLRLAGRAGRYSYERMVQTAFACHAHRRRRYLKAHVRGTLLRPARPAATVPGTPSPCTIGHPRCSNVAAVAPSPDPGRLLLRPARAGGTVTGSLRVGRPSSPFACTAAPARSGAADEQCRRAADHRGDRGGAAPRGGARGRPVVG